MKLNLLIVFFFVIEFCNAQQPTMYWMQKGGGSGNDEAWDVVQHNESVYSTGSFSEYGQFGNLQIANLGAGDAFVSKTNANGEYEWVKRLGGNLSDRGIAIDVMTNGDVIVAGHVQGNVSFDGINHTTAGNSQDIFLCRISSDGILQWVKFFGNTFSDVVSDVKVNSLNEIILYCQFKGTIQVANQYYTSANHPLLGTPTYDLLLIKTDNSGNVIWSKHGKASRDDRSLQLSIDNQNNIYCTGIFSDTLMFMSVYPNQTLNTGFVLKCNNDGNVQWMRRVQSSVTEINGICCMNNKVYITGNYSGIQRFSTGNGNAFQNLTNPAINKYYIACYDADGNYQWAISESSDNYVKTKGITFLANDKIAIAGEFECQHTQYSAIYGNGLFISRGKKDVFVSLYSETGERQWSKQFGSISEDEVNAINFHTDGNPLICGSFENSICAPASADWVGSEYSFIGLINNTEEYCGDVNYHYYAVQSSRGNKDILIAKPCDENRKPLDIFIRINAEDTCGFSKKNGFLTSSNGQNICGTGQVQLKIPTGPTNINGVEYSFLWNNGSTGSSININQTQTNSIIANANNTCFGFNDTITTIVIEAPPDPSISCSTAEIKDAIPVLQCLNKLSKLPSDNPVLVGNFVSSPFISYWTLPNGAHISTTNIVASEPGYYQYTISRNDSSCAKTTCVLVVNYLYSVAGGSSGQCDNTAHPLAPLFLSNNQPFDTLFGCPSFNFDIHLVDSINFNQNITSNISLFAHWKLSGPFTLNGDSIGSNFTFLRHKNFFHSTGYGEASVKLSFLIPPLNIDTLFQIEKHFFINEYTSPEIEYSLNGNFANVCPSDTPIVIISTNAEYVLPNSVFNITNQPISFQTLVPGLYPIGFSLTDQVTGCQSDITVAIPISYKQAPTINMNPEDGVICPDDSVLLSINQSSNVNWIGPSGESISELTMVNVNIAGYYYAFVTDSDGCELVSNTIEVKQFTTPGYSVNPFRICKNGSATIVVDLLEGDTIVWAPPLSGNSFEQTVSEAGIYSFDFIKCGQLTTVSVEVLQSDLHAKIQYVGDSILCVGSEIVLSAPNGVYIYEWLPNFESENQISVTSAGTFILTLTDEFACSSSDTVQIQEFPLPELPSSPLSVEICIQDDTPVEFNHTTPVFWFLNTNLLSDSALFSISVQLTSSSDSLFIANRDSTTGCFSSKLLIPYSLKPPYLLPALADTIICLGTTFQLDISEYLQESSAFQWYFNIGEITSDSILIIDSIDYNSSGLYSIIASGNSDYCGSDTSSFYLSHYPVSLKSELVSLSPLCSGTAWNGIFTYENNSSIEWSYNSVNGNSDTININLPNSTNQTIQVNWQISNANGCITNYDTLLTVISTPAPLNLTIPDLLCGNDTISIPVNILNNPDYQFEFISNYPFELLNSNLIYTPVNQFGAANLSISIGQNGCFSSMSEYAFTIGVFPSIIFPDSIQFCEGDLVNIHPETENVLHYTWSTNETTNQINVSQQGWYTLTATSIHGCVSSDSVLLIQKNCILNPAPNIFTPNDDGYNDVFKLQTDGLKVIQMSIFNRWGQLVFETNEVNKGWDGLNLNGSSAPDGTYFYAAILEYLNGSKQELKGSLTLTR